MEDYGVYSRDGKKLPNSDEILANSGKFWGILTKKVLDRTINNVFGIVLHPVWVGDERCWLVRESKKWRLDIAVLWCKNLFKSRYE